MIVTDVTINETTNQYSVTVQDAVVGIQGKDAFQVWQEQNPSGSYDEWILALTPQFTFEIDINGNLLMTNI